MDVEVWRAFIQFRLFTALRLAKCQSEMFVAFRCWYSARALTNAQPRAEIRKFHLIVSASDMPFVSVPIKNGTQHADFNMF